MNQNKSKPSTRSNSANTMFVILLTITIGAYMLIAKASSPDYTETKNLELNVRGIELLEIDASAGFLVVKGSANQKSIKVKADILADLDDVELYLEKRGNSAILKADIDSGVSFNWSGDSPRIDLTLVVPAHLNLQIEDGSGSIKIGKVNGDINLKDGSGSITIDTIKGNIVVVDGSGSTSISNVEGNITIEDGSGSMKISDVKGLVSIDDGSGGIDVQRVKGGLTILNGGSGSLHTSEVEGPVTMND